MAAVRAAIVVPETDLDTDWLWGLLRPVTDLLDGPHRLHETLAWPKPRLLWVARNGHQ
jgi:hypothetical protein